MIRETRQYSPANDAIDTAAAAWINEREDGFTPGRAEAFAAWLNADPRHAAAIKRTEQAMDLLAEMPQVEKQLHARLMAAKRPPAEAPRPVPKGLFAWTWAAGLAAAVMLATGIWWLEMVSPGEPQRYTTAPMRQQKIALRDGSLVDLNVNSEVRVQLTQNDRRVTLAAGEAHFVVAHDKDRPFIVTAGGVAVRAVGTAFNIRLTDGGVDVVVTEGKVEITRSAAPAAMRPLLVAGERTVIATDNAPTTARIERMSPADLLRATEWFCTRMSFIDTSLREVLAQFNRRNETQLVLADPELGDRKIGGTFAFDQIEALVRLLEEEGDMVASRRDARTIVLHRAP